MVNPDFPPAVIDMCSQDNGGCARRAQCSQTGVNVSCSCDPGYSGDGFICEPIDRCADGRNGDCSEHARCISTGPVSGPRAGTSLCWEHGTAWHSLGQPGTVSPYCSPSSPCPQVLCSSCGCLSPGLCCCDSSGDVKLKPVFPTRLSKEQQTCQLCHSWAVLGAPGWSFKDNAGHFCRRTKADHNRPEDGTGSMV